MNKHTPGPWYAEGHKVFKDVGDQAHMVSTCGNWSEETANNAALIAAAPDLLAALMVIRDYTHSHRKLDALDRIAITQLADSVIEKATGGQA